MAVGLGARGRVPRAVDQCFDRQPALRRCRLRAVLRRIGPPQHLLLVGQEHTGDRHDQDDDPGNGAGRQVDPEENRPQPAMSIARTAWSARNEWPAVNQA